MSLHPDALTRDAIQSWRARGRVARVALNVPTELICHHQHDVWSRWCCARQTCRQKRPNGRTRRHVLGTAGARTFWGVPSPSIFLTVQIWIPTEGVLRGRASRDGF